MIVEGPRLNLLLMDASVVAVVRGDGPAPPAGCAAADLLSRVHEDLLALIDLLERDHAQGNASERKTPADDHVVRRGCRDPGEI